MNTPQKKADGTVLTGLAQAYGNEAKARQLLESWRWPRGPVCPHCHNAGEKLISQLEAHGASQRGVREGVYFCGACRRQFTVTGGTVLERSHVPPSKWLMALSLLCSSKKSVSANQIHRMIGVTCKTAWFMCHRIRFAMTPQQWPRRSCRARWKWTRRLSGPSPGPKRRCSRWWNGKVWSG